MTFPRPILLAGSRLRLGRSCPRYPTQTTSEPARRLGNDLGKYFVQNVTRLRDELHQCAVPDDSDTNGDSSTLLFIETFETFATLTEDVCMLIVNSKSTSYCLDPIPTACAKVLY